MVALWSADIRLAATSSFKLNFLLVMAAFIAAISLWFSSLPPWTYLALIPLFTWNAYLLFYRTKRIDVLLLAADGSFRVLSDGLWLDAELLPNAFVAPWLVVLRLRTSTGSLGYFCWLPILADTDNARQVRVVLRWRAASTNRRHSRASML